MIFNSIAIPLASVPVAEFAKFTKGFKVDAANNISVGESSMGQVSSTGNLNVAVGWRTLENNGGICRIRNFKRLGRDLGIHQQFFDGTSHAYTRGTI